MAKGRSKQPSQQRGAQRARARATGRGEQAAPKKKPFNWKQYATYSVIAIAVIGIGYYLVSVANSSTAEDPEVTALASANAGGAPIEVFTGSNHTVYHSPLPLPSEQQPEPQGLPTLVWFSAVTCEFCEQMDPFAHDVASQFQGRMHFVEKSIRQDRTSTGRYGVRGTPTFVLLDAQGRELDRFNFLRDSTSFASRIESGLQLGGF